MGGFIFCIKATKKIFLWFVLRIRTQTQNHAKGVYIINSVGIAYHQYGALYIIIAKEDTACGWWYAPSVMRYTLKRDDIPLLSQWIKKFDKLKLVEFFGWGSRIRTYGWRSQSNHKFLLKNSKLPIFPYVFNYLYLTPDLYPKKQSRFSI